LHANVGAVRRVSSVGIAPDISDAIGKWKLILHESAGGWFKGKAPSYSRDMVEASWVEPPRNAGMEPTASASTGAAHAHTTAASPRGFEGIVPTPSCQQGKNPDGSDCIACAGTGTLDLSMVPKSDVQRPHQLVLTPLQTESMQ